MTVNDTVAVLAIVLTVFGNVVALVRIYSRMEARLDVFEATAHAERRGLVEQITAMHLELTRLRDSKHDHTGTVMRHEGALKDIDRRVTRVEDHIWPAMASAHGPGTHSHS